MGVRTSARISIYGCACLVFSILAGCNTIGGKIAATAGIGATVLASRTPGHELEQIYYLGVFDPREQVPETIYRVIVKGQSSALLNTTRYASGWVPASLIDTLNSEVWVDPNGKDALTLTPSSVPASISTGRRLVLFGPEGFREAPRDHRLVIVMGSSPEQFFQAIDEVLGSVSDVKVEQANSGLKDALFQHMLDLKDEQRALKEIELQTVADFGAKK